MDTTIIELDLQTMARARRLAQLRGVSVATLIREVIISLDAAEPTADPVLGMFRDEPALLNEVIDGTMTGRERRVWRETDDG